MSKSAGFFAVVLFCAGLLFLSSCNTSGTDPSVSSGEHPDLEHYIEVSREQYGYPKVITEEWLDVDGDQSKERVSLLREWGPIFNEENEPCYENELYHYPLIRVEKDGCIIEHHFETLSYASRLCWMTDTLGRTLFIVSMETGGTGAGSTSIAALTFDGEKLSELEVPSYTNSGLSFCGFEAAATYRDGFRLEVSIAATGTVQEIPLGDYPTNYTAETSPYDEDGTCLFTASAGVDPVSTLRLKKKTASRFCGYISTSMVRQAMVKASAGLSARSPGEKADLLLPGNSSFFRINRLSQNKLQNAAADLRQHCSKSHKLTALCRLAKGRFFAIMAANVQGGTRP